MTHRQPKSDKELRRQKGFTVIELMVAGATGLLMMVVLFTIVLQAASMTDLVQSRVDLNQQAREMHRILQDGGIGYGGETIPGLSGMNINEANFLNRLSRTNDRLQLGNDPTNPTDSLASSRFTGVVVTCTEAGNPLPECLGTEEITITGFLAADPKLSAVDMVASDGNDPRFYATTLRLIAPRGSLSRNVRQVSGTNLGSYQERFYSGSFLQKEAE